jgi:hypothetical protein
MNGQHNPDYWRRIRRLAVAGARNGGLNRDDAEDCAVEFEVMVFQSQTAPDDLDAPGALDNLRQQIWWHVKTCVYRRNKACRNLMGVTQVS